MTDPLSFPMESPLRWWKRREKLSAILVETGRTPHAVVWIEGNRQRVRITSHDGQSHIVNVRGNDNPITILRRRTESPAHSQSAFGPASAKNSTIASS